MRNKYPSPPIHHHDTQGGFSLVEIALALLIIGVMIGVILRGHQLYESAKLQGVLNQVDQFRMAHTTFIERFGTLPGDFNEASQCLGLSALDGDGDGIIGGLGLDPNTDAGRYWRHLAAAQLLNVPLNDTGVPIGRMGGVFTIEHDADSSGERPGIWLVLGAPKGLHGDGGLLTPQQAYALNKKFDDGRPLTGMIRSETGRGAMRSCINEQENIYDLTVKEPVCVMYFQL